MIDPHPDREPPPNAVVTTAAGREYRFDTQTQRWHSRPETAGLPWAELARCAPNSTVDFDA